MVGCSTGSDLSTLLPRITGAIAAAVSRFVALDQALYVGLMTLVAVEGRASKGDRMTTRIALIHPVPVAVEPVQDAFRQLWPEAECANILDDSLSLDREREGVLTEAMKRRVRALAEYGAATGAAGVLFTCSAFGEAIEAAAAQLQIPVLKPNEAMFEAALAVGRRIGMLATFAPSVGSMEDEFREIAGTSGAPR